MDSAFDDGDALVGEIGDADALDEFRRRIHRPPASRLESERKGKPGATSGVNADRSAEP
jgi:hypothetical protein